MNFSERATCEKRAMMLGTFGFRPKGTMTARAAGIAVALRESGWSARIATVPWDYPADSGARFDLDGIPCSNTRTVRPALWPLALAELVRESERFRPDVIHVFKPKGFGDLAGRWLHRRGLPVIVDMDDWEGQGGWNDVLPYRRIERSLFDWQERTWPARAPALTVASRALQQRAIELGATADRVFYVPNGLSCHRFREISEGSATVPSVVERVRASGAFNILLYTRFVEFDPSFAVEVLRETIKAVPEARLVVAGGSPDGSSERRLVEHARQAGISDRVLLLGWIDASDIGPIARSCDAALVPFDDTWINRSKCSVKLVELMATSVPIVASGVGENREYLHGGRFGVLARPGDAAHHADGLIQINRNPGWATDFGHAARERAGSRYRWTALVDEIAAAYQRALEQAAVAQSATR